MPIERPRKRASASSSRSRNSSPATMIEPESGRSSPVITISSVDLPEPDGPSRPTASPRPILRSIFLRIWTRAAPRPSDRLTPERTMLPAAKGCPEMSFMLATGWRSFLRARSYGARRAFVQIAAVCSVAVVVATVTQGGRAQTPLHIVALGDSLTAGYGLADKEGFVPRLQAALAAKGAAVAIANAGVSGDTAAD